MNENLDLRNRILKMRQSNNLVDTKTNSSNSNLMSKFENTIKDDKPKNNFLSKNIGKDKNEEWIQNSIKNNSENLVHDNRIEKKTAKDMFNDNEAKFLMLANKFNEAVEVILELSQKVEKLERNLHQNSSQTKKLKSKSTFFNLKGLLFLFIIPIIIIIFFTLPIDFSLMELIIIDVLSMI